MTIEDVENICIKLKNHDSIEFPLRLEMKHVDTFSSTILELVTSHGGDTTIIRDGRRLRFKQDIDKLDRAGYAAFARLHSWVHNYKIVRPYGTIDPVHSSNQYCGRPTWAVARHWYSSLINNLLVGPHEKMSIRDVPKIREIAVTPIPRSSIPGGRPCCMWGEWYLGVESGAENMELAYAIIDNLLAPSKVITHALTGAGLPVCKAFYEETEYGNTICIGTGRTYRQIKDIFFSIGIRRSDIAEYRLVMQKLNAAGLQLLQDVSCNTNRVWDTFRDSVESIVLVA